MPLTENLPVTPVSPYGTQKYVGEVYCKIWSRVYGIETVSLRYFNVYGPRQSSVGAYASVIARFIDMRAKGEPLTITGDGNQTRDFVHIDDVVRANLLAMTESTVGSGDVINIGNTTSVSVNRIAELIGGEIVHIEPRLEARDSQASIEKAKTILGWEPEVSIEEGIRGLKEFNNISSYDSTSS
jgi:UDP-glucose 4-epimerase